jgi:hypothetical protein
MTQRALGFNKCRRDDRITHATSVLLLRGTVHEWHLNDKSTKLDSPFAPRSWPLPGPSTRRPEGGRSMKMWTRKGAERDVRRFTLCPTSLNLDELSLAVHVNLKNVSQTGFGLLEKTCVIQLGLSPRKHATSKVASAFAPPESHKHIRQNLPVQRSISLMASHLRTGWSRSPCGALLFRHVVNNDESYWGSTMLNLLSV